ncbi:hypothetical protein BOVAC1_4643 [Bacteroides ovatus]|uniref:Uncharacterized protein n=1 Tax=Bacteroides ovatus (strain ATCC 8483 / DSM 1896 / JCM 5824 / BCRC 10623 / CCUG 4943 / NCTC 11153) TaxID=411476 RepID=A0AAN3DCM4_BACO1|nr:hypothetical protein BACOVA_00238 [Bacteroides ovatus ATCC 8483]CAG9870288.1 hypothetical protein BOVAC1_4643 [Bacteroides ovatus]
MNHIIKECRYFYCKYGCILLFITCFLIRVVYVLKRSFLFLLYNLSIIFFSYKPFRNDAFLVA